MLIAALDGDWTSVVLYTTGPDKLVVLGTLVDFWPVLCEWDRVVCVLTLLSYLDLVLIGVSGIAQASERCREL